MITTDAAPAPFRGAPYSQGIRAGDLVFVSGQIPVAPGTSDIVGETIEEQTEQVLKNVAAILEAAGSSLDRLVKTTVLLADLADFERMNAVYARYVGDAPPARATFGVQLPAGIRVEIEAVGAVG